MYATGEKWDKDCNECTCTSDGPVCDDKVCSCDFDGVTRIHNEVWENSPGEVCSCQAGVVFGPSCNIETSSGDSSFEDMLQSSGSDFMGF